MTGLHLDFTMTRLNPARSQFWWNNPSPCSLPHPLQKPMTLVQLGHIAIVPRKEVFVHNSLKTLATVPFHLLSLLQQDKIHKSGSDLIFWPAHPAQCLLHCCYQMNNGCVNEWWREWMSEIQIRTEAFSNWNKKDCSHSLSRKGKDKGEFQENVPPSWLGHVNK